MCWYKIQLFNIKNSFIDLFSSEGVKKLYCLVKLKVLNRPVRRNIKQDISHNFCKIADHPLHQLTKVFWEFSKVGLKIVNIIVIRIFGFLNV